MEITNMPEKKNGGDARKIIMACVIAGLAFGFFWGRTAHRELKKSDSLASNVSTTTPEKKEVQTVTKSEKVLPAQKNENNSPIAVSNQHAGQTVFVKNVSLAHDGWIAVREIIDGELGSVLGAQYLSEGKSSDVNVELLRETVSGKKYAVVLYRDNGDHIFSTKSDALVGVEDKPMLKSFVAL
jgi:hypothetical protein